MRTKLTRRILSLPPGFSMQRMLWWWWRVGPSLTLVLPVQCYPKWRNRCRRREREERRVTRRRRMKTRAKDNRIRLVKTWRVHDFTVIIYSCVTLGIYVWLCMYVHVCMYVYMYGIMYVCWTSKYQIFIHPSVHLYMDGWVGEWMDDSLILRPSRIRRL